MDLLPIPSNDVPMFPPFPWPGKVAVFLHGAKLETLPAHNKKGNLYTHCMKIYCEQSCQHKYQIWLDMYYTKKNAIQFIL